MSLPIANHYAQLFYDGQCPLCTKEMVLLRKYKHAGLTLVDIHSLLQITAAEREQLLRRLHLLLPSGRWRLGVDATVDAWAFTPLGILFAPLRWSFCSGLVDRIYQRWADKRYCKAYACTLNNRAPL